MKRHPHLLVAACLTLVDGLSGSTLTSKGVDHLVRFWVGNIAFGPYLERLRAGEV